MIRSAFGFGEALIAVPLLAFFIPMQVAAPLAVLVSITIAAVVVAQDWCHIHWRSAGWLVLSTIFGIPLGLVLLTCAPESVIKVGLGVLILLFAVFSLSRRGRMTLRHESRRWMLVGGFIAGILGGSLRNERTPAGDLWFSPRLDRAALSGNIAGLLSSRKHPWNDRVFERGNVDACCDTRLFAMSSCDAAGCLPRTNDKPSTFGNSILELRLPWAGGHRICVDHAVVDAFWMSVSRPRRGEG